MSPIPQPCHDKWLQTYLLFRRISADLPASVPVGRINIMLIFSGKKLVPAVELIVRSYVSARCQWINVAPATKFLIKKIRSRFTSTALT